jgi:hypothetical protein
MAEWSSCPQFFGFREPIQLGGMGLTQNATEGIACNEELFVSRDHERVQARVIAGDLAL